MMRAAFDCVGLGTEWYVVVMGDTDRGELSQGGSATDVH